MTKKLNMELMEIFGDEAIYYHAEDCPSFCDFSCNGSQGDLIAQAYNAGMEFIRHNIQKENDKGDDE